MSEDEKRGMYGSFEFEDPVGDTVSDVWSGVVVVGVLGLVAVMIAVFLRIGDIEARLENRDQQCEWCMAAQEQKEGK